MISIIVPLYNNKGTIRQTIESILSQTERDLEIIVVDDGSTDGSLSVIKKNDKVKVLKGNGNNGANWARNFGTRYAQGEYLFFCDADIILRNDALEKLKNALDSKMSMGILDTANTGCVQDAHGHPSFAYSGFKLGWKIFKSREFNAEELKRRNYISTMSLIKRKDFPGFDENLKKFQDWDLWLTMLKQGKRGIFVPKILFYAKPSRQGKSKWLPRFFYKIPWKKFGIKIKALEEYSEALEKIKKKYKIEISN